MSLEPKAGMSARRMLLRSGGLAALLGATQTGRALAGHDTTTAYLPQSVMHVGVSNVGGGTAISAKTELVGSGAVGLRVTQRTANAIPLSVQGAANQSANLQEWQTSTGTTVASMS